MGRLTEVAGYSNIAQRSLLKPISALIAQRPGLSSNETVKWHYGEFIASVLPAALIDGAILHDRVLPSFLKAKQYSPEFIDHGIQHGFRVGNNAVMGAVFSPEIRSLKPDRQIDLAPAIIAAAYLHDCLQLDNIDPSKRREGHDLVAGKWFAPGLMILGNLTGKTKYTEAQIALTSALVASHEVENPDYGFNLPPAGEINNILSRRFNRQLSEVFPSLRWLAEQLQKGGINLFSMEIDYSVINQSFFEKARSLFMAADLREQVAPPSWAAMRSIKARPGRLFLDQSVRLENYYHFIDQISKGDEPASEKFFDTTARAAYETARGLPNVKQPAFMRSWMKYSQSKRGGYHIDLAHDLVAISHNLTGQTLFRKYLELCREVEAETWQERAIKTSELSDTFERVGRLDLDQIAKISRGKMNFSFRHDFLQILGSYIFKEFAAATMALKAGADLMQAQGDFDENIFLSRVEAIINYAKKKNAFYAAPLDGDIFSLPIKKLTISLTED